MFVPAETLVLLGLRMLTLGWLRWPRGHLQTCHRTPEKLKQQNKIRSLL